MLKKGIILLLLLLVFSCSGVQNVPPSVKTETRQTSAQPTQIESKLSPDEEKTILVKTVGNTPTYAEQTEDGMHYYFKYISDESRFQNEAEEKAYSKALRGISDIVCGVTVEKEGVIEKETEGRKGEILNPKFRERERMITKTKGVLKENLSPVYVSQNWKRTIKYGIVENFWVSTLYIKIRKTDFKNMSGECISNERTIMNK